MSHIELLCQQRDSSLLIPLPFLDFKDLEDLLDLPSRVVCEVSHDDKSFRRLEKIGAGVGVGHLRKIVVIKSIPLLTTVLMGKTRHQPHLKGLLDALRLHATGEGGSYYLREVVSEHSDLEIPWGEVTIGGALAKEISPQHDDIERVVEEFFHPHDNEGEQIIWLTEEA